MTTLRTTSLATGMRAELSSFLTRNLNHPRLGWPRLVRSDSEDACTRRAFTKTTGPRVLIVGDLALELRVEVNGTRTELLDVLHGEKNGRGLHFQAAELAVGGFVGRTVPVAAALGARISVCTVVSDPMPDRLRDFFKVYDVDARFATPVAAPCPTHIQFRCADQRLVPLKVAPSEQGTLDVAAALDHFDVALVDGCELVGGSELRRRLIRFVQQLKPTLTLGLRADGHWNRRDFGSAHGGRIWTFVRQSDARRLAKRLGGYELANEDDQATVRRLARLGPNKLVVQLGRRGAVLLNGFPCPYYVRTCAIDDKAVGGAGAILLAVTTLSAAAGADDRTNLRRGVAAATGAVAGLPPPRSLDELDVP